jgi:parallel beta-helix repeat protein
MTRIDSYKFLTCILVALAGAAVPARALTSINSCPAVIAAPGNYQLTADLPCTVVISASSVSLALNGHTITAPPNLDGIDVNFTAGVGPGSGRLNHIGIQGPGVIVSGSPGLNSGIYIVGTDYSQIDLVTIEYGFGAGISDYKGVGNTHLTIGSNVIAGAGGGLGFGIFMNLGCISCTISGNDASGNSVGGIVLEAGSGNSVTNNTANANGVYGILLYDETGGRVTGNVTNGNMSYGITLASGAAEVFSNTSSRANGIYDLYDATTACSGDYWGNNVFQTSADGSTSPSACIH